MILEGCEDNPYCGTVGTTVASITLEYVPWYLPPLAVQALPQ